MSLNVRVESHGIACELGPLAVTRPDPWGPGLLYEFGAHLDVSPTILASGGDLRAKMIEMFARALDAYIEQNKARQNER